MLPVEGSRGQLWLRGQFLCDVDYEISQRLAFLRHANVQRILLSVPEEHCATLLDAYDLTLVLADGQRYAIPRPLQGNDATHFECYFESPIE